MKAMIEEMMERIEGRRGGEDTTLWFALQTEDYEEWDDGSSDLEEAVKRMIDNEEYVKLVVIEESSNSVCIDEFDREEIEDMM